MKQNKLKIKIQKPVQDVFKFTINPKNTSKWIDGIVTEEASEWPIKISTIYRNKNKQGQWSEYKVVALKKDKIFELESKDRKYHVRYTYRPINNNETELEYFEWVDNTELEDPFNMDTVTKLKLIIENKEI